jgi:uncharacterized membrane protein
MRALKTLAAWSPFRRGDAREGHGAGRNMGRNTERSARLSAGAALYGGLVVLTLAGIAHLLVVLMAPRYALRDAASLLIGLGADGRVERLEPGRQPAFPDADPNTEMAACGFDLADGALRVRATVASIPLGLSIHLRGGGVLYAVTDRAAQRGVLEFVVLTRAQFEERVRRDEDGEGPRELRIVSPREQGVVLARALVRQPSERPAAAALVTQVACGIAD